MSNQKLQVPVTIRLNEEDLEKLKLEAKRNNMNLSTYVRSRLFSDKPNNFSCIVSNVNNIVLEFNNVKKFNPNIELSNLEDAINTTISELTKEDN